MPTGAAFTRIPHNADAAVQCPTEWFAIKSMRSPDCSTILTDLRAPVAAKLSAAVQFRCRVSQGAATLKCDAALLSAVLERTVSISRHAASTPFIITCSSHPCDGQTRCSACEASALPPPWTAFNASVFNLLNHVGVLGFAGRD